MTARRPRRPALVVVGLVALAGWSCASCATSGVTSARVEGAVGPSFSRLYAVQQDQLGRAVTRPAPATASCARTKAGQTDHGAGDDWACTLDYPFPDGHVEPIAYDVRVQATGCYTAQGPSQVVGPQQQTSATGSSVTNPLFEFDGCFALP